MEEHHQNFDLNELGQDGETAYVLLQSESAATLNLQMEQADFQYPPTNEASQNFESSGIRLSSEQRGNILFWLLNRATTGKLQRGSIKAAAQEFSISVRTISKIWNTAKQQRDTNERHNVTTKYHNCGRKKIKVPTNLIIAMGMGNRSCIRDLAFNLGLPKTTVHRMIKDKLIRPHSNSLHPTLKDANKVTRMEWILSLLPGNTPEAKKEYHHIYDFVHLDEKWFYLSKKTYKVYLAQGEKGKYRSASSSKFIHKVMFTAVVARPRFNTQGECTFDGRIGIFPFTYQEAAKRGSKNRGKKHWLQRLLNQLIEM